MINICCCLLNVACLEETRRERVRRASCWQKEDDTQRENRRECTCWEGSCDSTENYQHRVIVLTEHRALSEALNNGDKGKQFCFRPGGMGAISVFKRQIISLAHRWVGTRALVLQVGCLFLLSYPPPPDLPGCPELCSPTPELQALLQVLLSSQRMWK